MFMKFINRINYCFIQNDKFKMIYNLKYLKRLSLAYFAYRGSHYPNKCLKPNECTLLVQCINKYFQNVKHLKIRSSVLDNDYEIRPCLPDPQEDPARNQADAEREAEFQLSSSESDAWERR